MNTETGVIYRGEEAIEAAKLRGEVLTPISAETARQLERERNRKFAEGYMRREARR